MTTLIAAVDPAGGAAIGEVIGATAGAMVATTLLFALGFGHRSGRTQLLERWSGFAARVAGLPKWVALPSAIVCPRKELYFNPGRLKSISPQEPFASWARR